jgi:hypothetical protein
MDNIASCFASASRCTDGTSVQLPQLRRSLKPARLEREKKGRPHA